ncbi:MAG: hypothetical protein ACOYWZ_06400 [Bacillota bacterium]
MPGFLKDLGYNFYDFQFDQDFLNFKEDYWLNTAIKNGNGEIAQYALNTLQSIGGFHQSTALSYAHLLTGHLYNTNAANYSQTPVKPSIFKVDDKGNPVNKLERVEAGIYKPYNAVPKGTGNAGVGDFTGTLKGQSITLKNVKTQTIQYTKRSGQELADL